MKLLSSLKASQATKTRRQAGVTLIESAVCLAITCVTLGAAVPGFDTLRQQRQLDGAAAQLETDLMFVRSLAVAQNRGIRVSFAAAEGASCYVVHTGAVGDCSCGQGPEPSCSAGTTVYRSVHFDAGSKVQLQSNVRSILFDPVQGTSTPTGTLRVTAPAGTVHQVVSIMGRVRSCTPTPGLRGYPAC